MKSRTSFFNPIALRKDILRYAPVWALYTILSVTGVINLMGFVAVLSKTPEINAAAIGVCIGAFSVLNLIYALITVLMLYGDLFNSRLCYALHAMPLRREGWFLTHTMAGLAFSLVPNFVISLCMMLFFGKLWYVALLWFLGMTLEYLFFFGLASLCAVSTGKRFAAAAVYVLVNFLSLIAALFVLSFYAELMYGINIRYDYFLLLSPVVWLCTLTNGLLKFEDVGISKTNMILTEITPNWWYLVVIAVLGLAFLALAMVLYRRRKLESAGDFMAFPLMGSFFSIIVTLTAGMIFRAFGRLFAPGAGYVFLIVGVIVGYFISRMLIQRTVRVFGGKNFLKCGIILTLVILSLLGAWLDPIGITRWTPNPNKVTSVTFSQYDTTDYLYHFAEGPDAQVTVEDEDEIAELVEIHKLLLEEGEPETDDGLFGSYISYDTEEIYITYTLRSGRKVTRCYTYERDSKITKQLRKYYGRPEYVLRYQDWEEYLDNLAYVEVEWNQTYRGRDARGLMEAVKADCEKGAVVNDSYEYNALSLGINMDNGDYQNIFITEKCTNTLKWLEAQGYTWIPAEEW